MYLFVMKKKEFDSASEVNPLKLNLELHNLLGEVVYTAVWAPELGRDDLEGAKGAEVARVAEQLRERLKIVREEGVGGSYITDTGSIWREDELIQDLTRLELFDGYEESKRYYEALCWFKAHADVIQL